MTTPTQALRPLRTALRTGQLGLDIPVPRTSRMCWAGQTGAGTMSWAAPTRPSARTCWTSGTPDSGAGEKLLTTP